MIEVIPESPLRYMSNVFKMVQCRHTIWYFHFIFSSVSTKGMQKLVSCTHKNQMPSLVFGGTPHV